MDTVHQIIESKQLSKVIKLPKSLQNTLVEITIKPAAKKEKAILTRSKLRAKLSGSHTELLSGILQPKMDINLDEIRDERRSKL